MIRVAAVLLAITAAGSGIALAARRHHDCRTTRCLEAVAQTYLDALGSDDPAAADRMRVAPGVVRWENGVRNVSGAAQLREQVVRTQALVADVRDVRWFPVRGGHDIFAAYVTDGGLTADVSLATHVMERLRIEHGQITEIEIEACIGGPGESDLTDTQDPTGVDFAPCVRGPRLMR